MFKKLFKRTAAILAAATVMMGTVGSTVQVLAANVKDATYSIYVNSSSGSFKEVASRDKQNSTKVYVKLDSAPSLYTQVRVYGNRNTSGFYNETKGTTARVQRGVASSITNYCYENRNSNYTYVLAKLKFRSGSSATGTVAGV